MGEVSSAFLMGLQAVTVRKGKKVILEDVDFAICPGEIVAIVGPNGAGKTTLARVLLGLERVGAGSVERRAGLRIGYLPQKLQLDPVLPVTVRRLMSLSSRVSDDGIAAALTEVGALALRDEQACRLSGGELQRVLLARALLDEPEVLVLDEPTQGIDFIGQIELHELISHIRERHGCSIAMISHDLRAVMDVADRVVCLKKRVLCQGAPRDVVQDLAYRRLFGPSASERRCMADREDDGIRTHGKNERSGE